MLPILINSDVLLDANSRLIDVVWLCNQKTQGNCKANRFTTALFHQRHLECSAEWLYYILCILLTVHIVTTKYELCH